MRLPLGSKTVLERSLEALIRSKVNEVVVVVRVEPVFRPQWAFHGKAKLVFNPYYRYGMSSSIRRGLRAIDPRTEGVLIALGDQPFLKAATVDALIDRFSPGKGMIVIPYYKRKRGHPVLFDRCYEGELLRLRGDEGGRSIVERYGERIVRVRTRSEGVVKDLDTWKDYQKACKMRRG